MTAFEWVERYNDRVPMNTDEHNSLVSLFAQAINAAKAEEREACANAVLDACHERIEQAGDATSFAMQEAVALGVEAIRARGR